MKSILSGLMITMCIVSLAVAADLQTAAQESEKGKTEAGTKYSMAPDGRFHTIHGKVVGMDCRNCHVDFDVKDLYTVRGDRKLPASQPGYVHKSRCLGCHREGGTATSLYGATPK